MKLVDNWRNAHKWLSIQLCILGIVAEGLWDYIPVLQSSRVTILFFALIALGRLIKQEEKTDDSKPS